MICKSCTKEIYPIGNDEYRHTRTDEARCSLFARPCIEVDRHLDAAAILSEMEARHPTPSPYRAHKPNPDNVEGTFEGEL